MLSDTLKNARVDAQEIDPRSIKKYEHNPRQEWEYTTDDPEFVDLVKSIELTGITDRLVVTENTNPDDPEEYDLWYGHRRHAAALENDLDLVPVDVMVGNFSELDQIISMSNSETHHKPWSDVQKFIFVDRGLSIMEREENMEGVTKENLATYFGLTLKKLRSFQKLRTSNVLAKEFVSPTFSRPVAGTAMRRDSERLSLLETVDEVVSNLVNKHPTAVRAHYRNAGKPDIDLTDERNIENLRQDMVDKIDDYEDRGNIGRIGPLTAFQSLKKITDADGAEGTFAKGREIERWLGSNEVLREDLIQYESVGTAPGFDTEFEKIISLLEGHIVKNVGKLSPERLSQYERNWRSLEVMAGTQSVRGLKQIERNNKK